MSAFHHVNPYQMKLFYDADDIMNMRAGDDEDWDYFQPLSTFNQPSSLKELDYLVDEKTKESDRPEYDDSTGKLSLSESIAKEGIKEPISIGFLPTNEPILINGHHRTVVAHRLDPNMYIPHNYVNRVAALPNRGWTKSYDDQIKKK